MSQEDFLLFHNAAMMAESILYAGSMTAFLSPFLKEDSPKKPNSLSIRLLVIFGIYMAWFLVCLLPFGRGWIHLSLVIVSLMACSGFLGIEKMLLFLLGVIFFCVRSLSMMLMWSVSYLEETAFLSVADTPEQVFRNAAAGYVVLALSQFLLFAAMLWGVGKLFRRRSLKLHIRELCRLLLTPVTGIIFVNIIVQLLIVPEGDYFFQLYERFPAFLIIIPLAAVLFYTGILSTIASCQKIIALQEEQKEHFAQQQQISALQKRMEEMEQLHSGIRRMKHEMRSHLTNIKGLAQSGNYDDMERYLSKMDESMDALEFRVRTGNAVTDVIVNERQKTADRKGIEFQSEFIYPAGDGYDAYDIGIILSNLLQNALEACENMTAGKRYIFLSGRQKRKFYLINVRNSYQGEVIFDRYTQLPVSTKESGGIGLSNVKREAEKYQGSVDIQIEKEEFSATVLLQKRKEKKCTQTTSM